MYKINYKAIMLVFLFQILAAIAWYSFAPSLSFLEGAIKITGDKPQHLSVGMITLIFCSIFVHVLFVAWLLIRVKGTSAFGRFVLVIGMWLFIVLPNYVVLNLYLNHSALESTYLLSYGAISCLITALILPFWRSARSIFKG
ncbi:hypothetical protein MUS1_13305 [Marinomonas ushuaiensis DSM 15871]|uniref:Uncharacterized protein n=1 Tax=Marinomonas ushuaiensis DSM 15871 TaxID=1122207 RepID=X7E709_9GAMM|nr:hypothetical protein [Marinomonas ushuaiensis]ETX10951.1 hypothetical protein MUS1_13305 [Marinomonas ushuaiensis DSM 15871]